MLWAIILGISSLYNILGYFTCLGVFQVIQCLPICGVKRCSVSNSTDYGEQWLVCFSLPLSHTRRAWVQHPPQSFSHWNVNFPRETVTMFLLPLLDVLYLWNGEERSWSMLSRTVSRWSLYRCRIILCTSGRTHAHKPIDLSNNLYSSSTLRTVMRTRTVGEL